MDDIWQRHEVESPCNNVCVIHRESGFCMGCYRTGDEISRWSGLDSEARNALVAALPARATHVKGKRRGRRKK